MLWLTMFCQTKMVQSVVIRKKVVPYVYTHHPKNTVIYLYKSLQCHIAYATYVPVIL